jgi:hypothetical protein
MKNKLLHLAIISLTLCASSGRLAAEQRRNDVDQKKNEAEKSARPEIEEQRQQAEKQAEAKLDPEAVAAITETAAALKAIADNRIPEALSAIERATGKIDVLLARNPKNALVPVAAEVHLIDLAPLEIEAIKARARLAERATDDRDFPAARVVLDGLTSEIRVRTSTLPLVTYPVALKTAARLLDEKKNADASGMLLVALNTLVVMDQATPLPLLLARAAIDAAQAQREKNKAAAQTHLATARLELERAKELGYAAKDPEYTTLNKSISDLEKQVKGNGDTASAFERVKDRLTAFFRRQSEPKRSS